MNVLSLFDGMSCGQIALDRAGFNVDNYFASEIDKYAMKVAKANYPNMIHLPSVEFVTKEMFGFHKIDLLIGGSPCQGFSFAGKQLNFNDPRSALFFEFVRILKEIKPKYFLLENVKMKKEYQDVITQYLGVEPIEINSSLVSAQNRRRLYWTNIPGVEHPKDKGILLNHILEDDFNKVGRITGRYLIDGKRADTKVKSMKGLTTQRLEVRKDSKSGTLTTVGKDNVAVKKIYNVNPSGKGMNGWVYDIDNAKSPTLTTNKGEGIKIRDKSKCVRSSGRGSYERHEWDSISDCHYRKLTPLECERLQTVPDNYTNHVSKSQRYKMLGNGWTVDVIVHILKNILK